jgi:hypothetical protein
MYEAQISKADSPYKKREKRNNSSMVGISIADQNKSNDSTRINSVFSPMQSKRLSLINGGSMQINP